MKSRIPILIFFSLFLYHLFWIPIQSFCSHFFWQTMAQTAPTWHRRIVQAYEFLSNAWAPIASVSGISKDALMDSMRRWAEQSWAASGHNKKKRREERGFLLCWFLVVFFVAKNNCCFYGFWRFFRLIILIFLWCSLSLMQNARLWHFFCVSYWLIPELRLHWAWHNHCMMYNLLLLSFWVRHSCATIMTAALCF